MKVLLVAEESAGIQVLRMLAATSHEVTAVLTSRQTRGGGTTVGGVADQLGLPVLSADRVREAAFGDWIRERDVDLLLNVHSLVVMDAAVVVAPRIGSFNLHPGPLPEYAGLNAPSWAIYNGETRHAVTVHWMEAEIDTGAIAYEESFEIVEDDTAFAVAARCVKLGVPLVRKLLEDVERGVIPRMEQDLSRRRYFGGAPPEGGRVVWSRPARTIVNLVRACNYSPFTSPWGHPSAIFEAAPINVTEAALTREPTTEAPGTVGPLSGDEVHVAAGDEWVAVRRLRVGGESISATAVLEPGMRVSDGEAAAVR